MIVSCNRSKKQTISVQVNPDSIPTIYSEDVTSLISDSGVTRYRVKAARWEIYSNAAEPYSFFPEGIYMERFDSIFEVDFSIKADTAYYFENKELWQAIGNVFVVNLAGDTFETSELFFDLKADPNSTGAIYTDKFFKLNQQGTVSTGFGMKSNISLTYIVTYAAKAEMLYEEGQEPDTLTPQTLHPSPSTLSEEAE